MVKGGMYRIKESGLEFQHDPANHQNDSPVSPEQFLKQFRDSFEMRILEQPSENELVFEMIHVDTSFVNALRRILLAEVPTVALENIYMWNNSSIIHDEVLAHRLGLVPLNVDARLLDEPDEEDDSPTDRNTVVFRLAVGCSRDSLSANKEQQHSEMADADDTKDDINDSVGNIGRGAAAILSNTDDQQHSYVPPADRPYTKHVYSRDLIWVPQGDQEERFPEGIRPVHDDILLAKLRPGQEIELEAHGRRGVGKDHAKFSPVATASYRLMPHIELLNDVYDNAAEELVHVYEPGVFELVATDPSVDPKGTQVKAKLVNPYACTMSRNYMRHPELAKSVQMGRVADHFIFSVESVGTYRPGVLVAEALRTLQRKCHQLIYHVEESQQEHVPTGEAYS